jgi:hypothetical protein
MVFAAKAANVAYMTPRNHRLIDPDFNRQCEEAIDYATELLEMRAFQRALEGDCELIVYMGVIVGHVKKFDSRLQIELLRAYRPQRFKPPGTSVNIGTRSDVFVLTEEQRKELREINRQWLNACGSVSSFSDSRPSAASANDPTRSSGGATAASVSLPPDFPRSFALQPPFW